MLQQMVYSLNTTVVQDVVEHLLEFVRPGEVSPTHDHATTTEPTR